MLIDPYQLKTMTKTHSSHLLFQLHSISHVVMLTHLLTKTKATGSPSFPPPPCVCVSEEEVV